MITVSIIILNIISAKIIFLIVFGNEKDKSNRNDKMKN